VLAELVRLLAEVERRQLYLGQGFASLFVFATDALGLSEDEAAKRVHACRAARKYPVIFEPLASWLAAPTGCVRRTSQSGGHCRLGG
jgi:hypothetical protein